MLRIFTNSKQTVKDTLLLQFHLYTKIIVITWATLTYSAMHEQEVSK